MQGIYFYSYSLGMAHYTKVFLDYQGEITELYDLFRDAFQFYRYMKIKSETGDSFEWSCPACPTVLSLFF
jgi:hypothetical protein